jgi:hypothetical protein
MKRLASRLLLAVLLGAAALYPLYLIAGNGYLRSGDLERQLNRRPERLLVEVESAWTPWPGVVHVRGFRIRNQTRTVQWFAAMDSATFTIRLLDLSRRELIVDGLHGSGVSFRLRRRVDNPRWVRKPNADLQPAIPGLANPPVRPPEVVYPPPPPGRPRPEPWRIRLGQVDLDGVREIWIDEVRFAGEARVAGGFDMKIRRRLRVDPTRVRIVSGGIFLGGGAAARPVLAQALGQVDGEMSSYSPAEHRGWDSLQFLNGRVRLEGVMPSLAFLDESMKKIRWLTLEAEGARVTADLRLQRGRVRPGTAGRLVLEAHGVEARVEGRPLQGDVLLRMRLQAADFQGRRFDISGTKLDVTQVRMAGMPEEGGSWWARAHLDRAVLEPGGPVLLRARVESTISDPRPIFAFAAPPGRRNRLLGWVDRLLDVRGVGAVADVEVGTGGLAIDHLAIAGGPALIQGCLRLGGPRRRGILYASYGRWDVGLELDGDQRDWKALKPKQWFAAAVGKN